MNSKMVIIKVGGSLIVPADINKKYLKDFVSIIKKHTKRGKKFIVIAGGGYTARWYRDAAKVMGVKDELDLHWVGTIATRLNAELLRTVFGKLAYKRSYYDLSEKINWRTSVLVAGGNKPGASTDLQAVLMAKKIKDKSIINMTNVDSLYTKDPRKYHNAKPIKEISWKDYRTMFGNPTKHLPGQNIPIDAVAAIESQKIHLETFYIGGKNLKNLDNLLSGKPWKGTRIY